MKRKRTVLVCVTPQPSSSKLVKAGKAIAERTEAALEIVSVLPVAESADKIDCTALENIYRTAKEQGGETAVYFSDNPILTLAAHIAKRKPLTIVVGLPGENSNNFVHMIHSLLPEIPVSMVGNDGKIYNMLQSQAAGVTVGR